jgi:archaellum component FlaF (FlaF/FlaG flagellin family)
MNETIDATEARLSTHEQVCTERYKAVEQKFKDIETRFDTLAKDVANLRTNNDTHFKELKELVYKSNADKFKVMVTTAGSVIVALLGLIGYIIIKS